MTDNPSAPNLQACRLWSRPGRDGSFFLSGKWGGLRVLVVPNPEKADAQDADWLLVLKQDHATERKPQRERE